MKGSRKTRALALVLAAPVAFGLLAVSGFAGTDGPGGTPVPASFRLADGSAGCSFLSSGELACRAANAPEAVVLDQDGGSRTERGLELPSGSPSRVLLSAESWWHGGYSCRVRNGGISCSSVAGGSIAVRAGAD